MYVLQTYLSLSTIRNVPRIYKQWSTPSHVCCPPKKVIEKLTGFQITFWGSLPAELLPFTTRKVFFTLWRCGNERLQNLYNFSSLLSGKRGNCFCSTPNFFKGIAYDKKKCATIHSINGNKLLCTTSSYLLFDVSIRVLLLTFQTPWNSSSHTIIILLLDKRNVYWRPCG